MQEVDFGFFVSLFGHTLSYWWLIIPAIFLGLIVGAIPGFSAANTIIILVRLVWIDIRYVRAVIITIGNTITIGVGNRQTCPDCYSRIQWTRIRSVQSSVTIIIVAIFGGLIQYLMHMFVSHKVLDERFNAYRKTLGRALLLGLEILVAADIIKTVALDTTIHPPVRCQLVVAALEEDLGLLAVRIGGGDHPLTDLRLVQGSQGSGRGEDRSQSEGQAAQDQQGGQEPAVRSENSPQSRDPVASANFFKSSSSKWFFQSPAMPFRNFELVSSSPCFRPDSFLKL